MNIATIGPQVPSSAAQGLVPAGSPAPEAFGSALIAALQPAAPVAGSMVAPQPQQQPQAQMLQQSAQMPLLDQAGITLAGTAPQQATAAAEPVGPKVEVKGALAPAGPPQVTTPTPTPNKGGAEPVLAEQPADAKPDTNALSNPDGPTVHQQPGKAAPAIHRAKAKDEPEAEDGDSSGPASGGDAQMAPVQPPVVLPPAIKHQQAATRETTAIGVQSAPAPQGVASPAGPADPVEPGREPAEAEGAGPAIKDTGAKSPPAQADAPKPDGSAGRADAAAPLPSAQPAPQDPASGRTAAAPAPLTQHAAAAHDAVVTARPGQIGHEMGVEIARHAAAGKDELLVRLNPQDMGRIEVRMSFDDRGSLRAVVTADSPAALDMLRRDAGDLSRTLADAGVRADTDSFRFTSRGGDSGTQMGWQGGRHDGGQGRHQGGQPQHQSYGWRAEQDTDEPIYRRLRTSGQVDLMA